MGYDPRQVAATVLEAANAKDIRVDHLKLQKLVYFAHGYHLGITGKPLLDEPIEAWRYGPVSRTIYRVCQSYGSAGLPADALDWDPIDPERDDDAWKAVRVIERVIEVYGQKSGVQLSAISHRDGSPWDQIHGGNIAAPVRDIPDPVIKAYFSSLLETDSAA